LKGAGLSSTINCSITNMYKGINATHGFRYSIKAALKRANVIKHYDDNQQMISQLRGSGIELVLVDPGDESEKVYENEVKFTEEDAGEDRIKISIKNIGSVILVATYPKYEFKDDFTEDEFEKLGLDEDDVIGKIEHIEIDDVHKGKGYAKLLMTRAIKIAKEKDLVPIYLNASPMGFSGLRTDELTEFYKKFGFRVIKKQGNNNLMLLDESEKVYESENTGIPKEAGTGSIVLIKGVELPDGKHRLFFNYIKKILFYDRYKRKDEKGQPIRMVILGDDFYRLRMENDRLKPVKIGFTSEEGKKKALGFRVKTDSIVLNDQKTPYHWETLKYTWVGNMMVEMRETIKSMPDIEW